MKSRIIVSLGLMLAAGTVAGCEILGLEDDVEVRVRNGSNTVLDEAVLFLPKITLEYTNLGPGEESPYQDVEKAYHIASASVVVGSDTARVQVIDYVGEKPLDGGRYTYTLHFSPGSPPGLNIHFKKDS